MTTHPKPKKPRRYTCKRCGVDKPFTDKHYGRDSRRSFGLRTLCKKCHSQGVLTCYYKRGGAAVDRARRKGMHVRITAKNMPRALFLPSYAINKGTTDEVLRTELHEFITKRNLTVGCNTLVNWCTKHRQQAEAGTCEMCADIAEAELVRYSLANFSRRYGTVAEAQIAKANKVKGWTAHHKGKGFKFADLPAWDELWTDIEGVRV